MLALGIRYLTGYAVATDVSSRENAEWPPHPARVFMAMAAAMFESGEDAAERDVLVWLEQQGSPGLRASRSEPRKVVTHYVPVDDSGSPVKGKKSLTQLQSVPLGRDRQPRTFPRVHLHGDTVFLSWLDSNVDGGQRKTLEGLCQKVTRIGHSSSMVQMWVEDQPPTCNLEPAEFGEERLRTVSPGTLDYLGSAFNRENVEAHADLVERTNEAKGAKKKKLREELQARFGDSAPSSLRPTISLWQAYRRVADTTPAPTIASGAFSRDLMVLTIEEGPVVGLESTWQLMTALHKAILSTCDPTPEWLSGHTGDGKPSQDPHLALMPLAFVGREHADGHLLGVALVLPKNVSARERGRALKGLLYNEKGQTEPLDLKAGAIGRWTLSRETRPSPPLTLQGTTWTGPSKIWASLTPIVLDRHPKAERSKEREAWTHEVAEIIAEGCERQGLPRPVALDVDKTSWHRGAPRAVGGKSAGFPLMPVKNGQTTRQQVHAWLQFPQAVEGPLLLGAGRYRGYGVCRPWKGRE